MCEVRSALSLDTFVDNSEEEVSRVINSLSHSEIINQCYKPLAVYLCHWCFLWFRLKQVFQFGRVNFHRFQFGPERVSPPLVVPVLRICRTHLITNRARIDRIRERHVLHSHYLQCKRWMRDSTKTATYYSIVFVMTPWALIRQGRPFGIVFNRSERLCFAERLVRCMELTFCKNVFAFVIVVTFAGFPELWIKP